MTRGDEAREVYENMDAETRKNQLVGVVLGMLKEGTTTSQGSLVRDIIERGCEAWLETQHTPGQEVAQVGDVVRSTKTGKEMMVRCVSTVAVFDQPEGYGGLPVLHGEYTIVKRAVEYPIAVGDVIRIEKHVAFQTAARSTDYGCTTTTTFGDFHPMLESEWEVRAIHDDGAMVFRDLNGVTYFYRPKSRSEYTVIGRAGECHEKEHEPSTDELLEMLSKRDNVKWLFLPDVNSSYMISKAGYNPFNTSNKVDDLPRFVHGPAGILVVKD